MARAASEPAFGLCAAFFRHGPLHVGGALGHFDAGRRNRDGLSIPALLDLWFALAEDGAILYASSLTFPAV